MEAVLSLLSPSQGWPSRVSVSPPVAIPPPLQERMSKAALTRAIQDAHREQRNLCLGVVLAFSMKQQKFQRVLLCLLPPPSLSLPPLLSLLPICPSLCFFPRPFLVRSQVIDLQSSIPVSLCTSVSVQVCVCLCLCGCLCVPTTI